MRLPGHFNGPEMEAVCLNFSQNLALTMDSCHVMFQDVSLVQRNLIIYFLCLSVSRFSLFVSFCISRIGVDQSINQSINQSEELLHKAALWLMAL